MHFQTLAALVLVLANLVSFTAANIHSGHSSIHKRRRNWNVYSNNTRLQLEDPAELQKRDGTKYVFMHHISLRWWALHCSRFPYTYTDWLDDINQIAAKGIDAIALNIGSADWERPQVASAYAAAQVSGTGIKLFYSFDMTEMPCDLDDLVQRVNLYRNHPNQFKVNGKTFISSFSGDCLGNSGWQSLKDQTNGYIMPFIWGLENSFSSWPSLDSWQCWGCAWPQGNYPKNTVDDDFYIGQLGTKYAATISPWFYTHLSYKNWYMRGDDWLIVSRWEELMQMRSTITFAEMVTWNDYGESSYLGPIKGAQPDGTTYANGYPHTSWYDLSQYYIKAFQTGVYPTITNDVVYFWARTHPAGAIASGDGLGKPTGWDWTEDSLWAVVFATSPATVILTCGSSSTTFSVTSGVNKLKSPLALGKITVQMIRNSQTIINYTPADYAYINNPVLYNYNAWVGSASATGGSTNPTSSSASATTSTATSSSTSPTATSGWTYQGCYVDSSDRVLPDNGPFGSPSMSISMCLSRCMAANYAYAGVEDGDECFCSNTLKYGSLPTSPGDCYTPCRGKGDDICGGAWRINVYSKSGLASTTATSTTTTTTTTSVSSNTPTTTTASGWSSKGCYVDSDSRVLADNGPYSSGQMSISTCQDRCQSGGYTYAGVEDGNQCFCSNTIKSGAVPTSASECSTTCAATLGDTCGGPWRINIYQFGTAVTPSTTTASTSTTPTAGSVIATSTGWSSVGCVAEGTTGTRRALTSASFSGANMTPQVCQALCAGYQYSGVEAGSECYCGNSLTGNGATGTIINSVNCQYTCAGDSSKKCGGAWTLNVYTKAATATSSWSNAGCFVDSESRMLRGLFSSQPGSLTLESCVSFCQAGGFTMAAMEYGQECYCGSQIYKTNGAGVSVDVGQCNMPCSGNTAELCGAGWRGSLYLKSGTSLV